MPSQKTLHSQQDFLDNQRGTIHIQDHCISFQIKRNKRIQNKRLLACPEEGLVVESPSNTFSLRAAQKLIQQHQNWVLKTINKIAQKQKNSQDIKKQAQSLLVFGQEKTLEIRSHQEKAFLLETANRIILGFQEAIPSSQQITQQLSHHLKNKAKDYFPLRIKMINKHGFEIKKTIIKDQKTIWGSCSEQNHIHLNWRLIMAPVFASDYILMHEMCHTHYLNHSKKFWQLVEKVYPDYQRAEEWFKKYGFCLTLAVEF